MDKVGRPEKCPPPHLHNLSPSRNRALRTTGRPASAFQSRVGSAPFDQSALMLRSVPLGTGAAKEMGAKYSFPDSCTVLPGTLRSVFMGPSLASIFKAPARNARAEAQATWERQHFNRWKLEQTYPSQSDIEHGIFFRNILR